MRETRGRLKIFLGAAPGVGKTYEMLASAQAKREDGVDVVIGVVETHGRAETQALVARLRGDPAAPDRLPGPDARGDGPRRHPRPPPGARPRRRARPHQRAREPPPQALPRRRGAARRRHRRLHHRQHPARREPQRRRRADHPHPGARDRARLDHRPRRRHRGRRHHPRRPDPAAEGRQGLRPRDRRPRARPLLLARQPHRAARARAARRRAAGRRPAPHPHAGQRHRRPVGRRRAGARLRQRGPERRRPRALRQAPRRPAARPLDRARDRDAAHRRSCRRSSATGIADTLRLAERLGGEALTLPGGQNDRRGHPRRTRRPRTSPRSSSASPSRSRWFELLHGSVVHDLVRLSGGISVHVIAGDAVEADPIPSKTVRTRPAGRRIDLDALRGGAARRRCRLRAS